MGFKLNLNNMNGYDFLKKTTNKPGEWSYLEQGDCNLLYSGMLKSNWMIRAISLLPVAANKGTAYALGNMQLHTGRELKGRFRRKVVASPSPFELVETDSNAFIPLNELFAMVNNGMDDEVIKVLTDFFEKSVPLDMLRIGFNGQRVSWPTNPLDNPNGEDVNIGWHQIAKGFNEGAQVLTEGVTIGAGGDFTTLDALACHVINTRIPEWLREDPRLVVMVGSELAAAERLRLVSAADSPSDTAAANRAVSTVAGHFAFIPPFMPGKRLTITTLDNLHIYTQRDSHKVRSEINDDNNLYETSYLRSEGYALGDCGIYAAVDESAVTIQA